MRNILITGITGTLGTEVTRQLNEEIEEFNIFGICRAEKNIVNFPHDAAISICDIRDKQRLERYIEIIEPDIIFHFAALKHVNMGEVFCEEFVKTNCNGTSNLCEIIAMPKNNHIRLVLSSTDKAVNPINVYGCTKYIAETMIKRLPSYVICRYGNVFGSNGSIIDRMKKGVIDGTGKELKLTDKEMTRFFISIENAAKFVIDMGLCLSMTGLHIPK